MAIFGKKEQKVGVSRDIRGISASLRGDKMRTVVLLILDGWGIAPPSDGNAVTLAKTPTLDGLFKTYPSGELVAAGESVGLPANEVGNTEVGHLNMGAGRTMLQHLMRINDSVKDGTFLENQAFIKTVNHVKQNKTKLHLMGLVGLGNVHSSIKHFYSLLEFCGKVGMKEVYLHLFTDGRDSPPQEGVSIIEAIEEYIKNTGVGSIATVAGRYYAMDRDRRWERIEPAYKAIVLGQGDQVQSAKQALEKVYLKKDQNSDEFVLPSVVMREGKPVATVDDGDGVIFFNFRIDRPRELAMAFTLENFENLDKFKFGYVSDVEKDEGEVKVKKTFTREKWPQNLFFTTMTQYSESIPVQAIAFAPEVANEALPEVIAKAGLAQMHMAESEKERFVTFYFNGLRESAHEGEVVVIVPSPKVATYDKKPEMSVFKLVDEFKKAIGSNKYGFVVMNFANADMVAHTGKLKATIKAMEAVDKAVASVVEAVLAVNGTLLITADHGNAEDLLTFKKQGFFFSTGKGDKNTDHSNNLIPFLAVNKLWEGKLVALPRGTLADVAPTILAVLGISPPEVMTGRNLLK